MTIRDTLVNIIGGNALRKQREADRNTLAELYDAYEQGRFRVPPQILVEQLSEYNQSTVYQLLRQKMAAKGWGYGVDTEEARIYQVNESRQQWMYSPLADWTVKTWTSYGLGEKVIVKVNDDDGQVLWDNTWSNSRIFSDDEIHSMSDFTCADGEIYLVAFHSVADGATVFEMLNTDEITEIVTDPENKNTPLYYKREYTGSDGTTSETCYYPDYHAFFYHPEDLKKAKLPDDANVMISEKLTDKNGTSTTVLHIAHNRKDASSLHGWPILGISAPYLIAHKSFMEDRLTVSHQKASLVRDYKVTGGSRGVAAVKAKLGTTLSSTSNFIDGNPPQLAGSSGIHNDVVEMTDLPMTTGAGDANTDNNMFLHYAGIGMGMMPGTMGLDTARYATAVQMDKTQATQWSKYQSFWACQFRKMVEIVLLAAEKWDKATFEDKGCTVSIDTLSLVDFPGVVTPISNMLNAIAGYVTDGTIPQQAARKLIKDYVMPTLTALGTETVADDLSDEILGIMTEAERKKAKREQEKAAKATAAIAPPETEEPDEEPAQMTAAEYWQGIQEFAKGIQKRREALAEKDK